MGTLKVGQKIKAKWDGAISEIIGIEKGIVTYKCYAYKNNHYTKDDYPKDGNFRDTEQTILECFTLIN